MKAVVMVAVMMLAGVSMAAAQIDGGHQVKVLSEKMDVLYFKVTHAYVGAHVTVVNQDGSKVIELNVSSKKVLIDFFNEVSGDYLVHIEKGGYQQDLRYHKA
jgi:hypothetical protein